MCVYRGHGELIGKLYYCYLINNKIIFWGPKERRHKKKASEPHFLFCSRDVCHLRGPRGGDRFLPSTFCRHSLLLWHFLLPHPILCKVDQGFTTCKYEGKQPQNPVKMHILTQVSLGWNLKSWESSQAWNCWLKFFATRVGVPQLFNYNHI